MYKLNLNHARHTVKHLNPNDLIIPRNEEETKFHQEKVNNFPNTTVAIKSLRFLLCALGNNLFQPNKLRTSVAIRTHYVGAQEGKVCSLHYRVLKRTLNREGKLRKIPNFG